MTAALNWSPGGCCCAPGFLSDRLGIEDSEDGIPPYTWFTNHLSYGDAINTPNFPHAILDAFDYVPPQFRIYGAIDNNVVPAGFVEFDVASWLILQQSDNTHANVRKEIDFTALVFDEPGTKVVCDVNGAHGSAAYFNDGGGGSRYLYQFNFAGARLQKINANTLLDSRTVSIDDNGHVFWRSGSFLYRDAIAWNGGGGVFANAIEALGHVQLGGAATSVFCYGTAFGGADAYSEVTAAGQTAVTPAVPPGEQFTTVFGVKAARHDQRVYLAVERAAGNFGWIMRFDPATWYGDTAGRPGFVKADGTASAGASRVIYPPVVIPPNGLYDTVP